MGANVFVGFLCLLMLHEVYTTIQLTKSRRIQEGMENGAFQMNCKKITIEKFQIVKQLIIVNTFLYFYFFYHDF